MVVEISEIFVAHVAFHATSKSAHFLFQLILLLLTYAHCARHLKESWAAFLTDSIMHVLGVHEATAVKTSIRVKRKVKV